MVPVDFESAARIILRCEGSGDPLLPGAPETRLPKNLLHRLDPFFVLFPEN
jgi:hypothetical protein